MPRVKIDYIVSFSCEDSANPASSLLAPELGARRWLSRAGAPDASVVLQLERSVQINAVHIGAVNAAMVEVLVGRSESPEEPYQVLVPRAVLLAPGEARRAGEAGEAARVRLFAASQLAPAAARRWDRLRLVCSQPYNKYCKYGLSFVHVFSPEGTGAELKPAADVVEPAMARRDSSDDDYRPGQLFAHRNTNQERDKNRMHDKVETKPTDDLLKNDNKKNDNSQNTRADREMATMRAKESSFEVTKGLKRRAEGGTKPLAGVRFVLSGYANPRRAQLRALATELGARYLPRWAPEATHLICAFADTPKLRAVRALPGGARVPAVKGEWLQRCAETRRRVPWQPFAVDAPQTRAGGDEETSSDCDTDDEIEKVMRQGKGGKLSESKSGEQSEDDADATREAAAAEQRGPRRPPLPAPFAGRSFALLGAPAPLARYVAAYGGLVLQAEDAADADFVVRRRRAASDESRDVSRDVSPDWVWRCHAAQRLLPTRDE